MKTSPILFSSEMVRSILAGIKKQTRRTQGLELINDDPDSWIIDGLKLCEKFIFHKKDKSEEVFITPKFKVGDILWVRETWQNLDTQEVLGEDDGDETIFKICYTYKASNDMRPSGISPEEWCGNWVNVSEKMFENANERIETEEVEGRDIWYPSIHMPKVAARLFLRVKNVRCERIRDISEDDSIAEGIDYTGDLKDSPSFRNYLRPELDTCSYFGFPSNSFQSLWEKINGLESWKKNPWVFVYEFELTEKPENFLL